MACSSITVYTHVTRRAEGREASTTAEKNALQTRLHGAVHDTTLRDQQSLDELVRLATQPEELGKGGGTIDDGKVVDTVRCVQAEVLVVPGQCTAWIFSLWRVLPR